MWILFVFLTCIAILVYLLLHIWWIFLLAYAIWTTLFIVLEEKAEVASPVFSCVIDGHQDENDFRGLKLIQYEDGKVKEDMQSGLLCRRTDNINGYHYFYLAINPDRKSSLRNKSVLISVEYFDLDQEAKGNDKGKRGITLQYDAVGNGLDNIFHKGGEVLFTSTRSWKFASFCVNDGLFENRQNGIGDFRFSCLYASLKRDYDLYIRRVILVPIQD